MEWLLREVSASLHGLAVSWWSNGGPAAKALPYAPPDISLDAAVCIAFSVALFCLNWFIRLLLVAPLARLAMGDSAKKRMRWTLSFMEVFFYGGSFIIGLRIVPSQEWIWPSIKWWWGFEEGGLEIMRSDLRCYYILYCARYIQQLVSVFLEPRQKDFREMLIHHAATIAVIILSYLWGWNRVGVVTMFLFDPADVFLHMAKMCKYIYDEGGCYTWFFIADRLFEIFAVVFFVTRLILYSYVVWSTTVETGRSFVRPVACIICIALIWILFLLQLFWARLLIKVIIDKLVYGLLSDIRDETEDEDEPDRNRKKDK